MIGEVIGLIVFVGYVVVRLVLVSQLSKQPNRRNDDDPTHPWFPR